MASPGHSGDPPPDDGQLEKDESTRSSVGNSKKASNNSSRPGSRGPKEKQRVRFGNEDHSGYGNRSPSDVDTSEGGIRLTERQGTNSSSHLRRNLSSVRVDHSSAGQTPGLPDSKDIADSQERSPIRSPRPSNRRVSSTDSDISDLMMKIPGKDRVMDERAVQMALSQQAAQNKAQRLSRLVNSHSAPASRINSPKGSRSNSPGRMGLAGTPLDLNNIPMRSLERRKHYSIEDDTDEDDEMERPASAKKPNKWIIAAQKYVRWLRPRDPHALTSVEAHEPPLPSGQVTPLCERDPHTYVPRPRSYREGVLSASLRLMHEQGGRPTLDTIPGGPGPVEASSSRDHPAASPPSSGASTPAPKHQKWYYKDRRNQSISSVENLISSSTVLAQLGISGTMDGQPPVRPRPKLRSRSTGALDVLFGRHHGRRSDDPLRIQVHIAETLSRQIYLVKLCKALMTYGAPTHRLEEYMRMSARVLEIQGQFYYIPTCMICAFDDATTHTTEVKIVRAAQGIDLSKLKDTHQIYKEVVHDMIGVDEAMPRLDAVMKRDPLYGPYVLVVFYGLASATVAPFAFKARFIDLPVAFLLGSFLGFLHLIFAPRSDLYTNIFEISAAVATSFLARLFGSLQGGRLFCFSTLAQSAIVLILPGYTLLCGSLELQSKSIVAGSVRLIYAVIYSLFLGYGITVGTAFYGLMDKNATSNIVCENPMREEISYIFVPIFTACLIVISQGRISQMFVMIVIACAGFVVNKYSAFAFKNSAEIAQTFGALAIGIIANLYSRLGHGLAAAALLPAIFVQVPSGMAAGGSLISGVATADQLTKMAGKPTSSVGNMTMTVDSAREFSQYGVLSNVAYNMIQVAIGITVGLFLSALVVYPFGKKRSGLFSF